jgi:hypothetical protein
MVVHSLKRIVTCVIRFSIAPISGRRIVEHDIAHYKVLLEATFSAQARLRQRVTDAWDIAHLCLREKRFCYLVRVLPNHQSAWRLTDATVVITRASE